MVGRLVQAEVRFVVVGGLAMRAHGSGRLTEDLDICYDTAPDNLLRLADTMAGWNAYVRGVARGLPFLMDVRTLRTTPVMTLVTDHGDIDIMDAVAGVGGYAEALAQSVRVESGGVPFRVLDLPALIRAKRASGRMKDREQLAELEALLARRRRVPE
jgi:predicted nucleotidyltransferase